MASSRKKVIVRLEPDGAAASIQTGYLAASRLLDAESGSLELLDVAGRLVAIPLRRVRYVAYVRDFNLDDLANPERLLRRVFLARPRTEGLWVRLTFLDGEVMEGLAGLDLSLIDDALQDKGVFLLPPDVRSNTQRLYVPRTSLSSLQVVGVVTTPSKGEKLKKAPRGDGTGNLFPS
jgi:hypothetical protein